MPPAIHIPGYRLLRELGRGGMATVHLAIQESLGREVALKLLNPELAADPNAAERFLREGRIAARLSHRHIVGIHDVGVHAGQPYLAMEYLPNGTVASGARLPPASVLTIVREVALALDHAHALGVIHRDIKPENILCRTDGSHALSDFGIARTTDSGAPMTQEGVTIGTPHYMSPEQLQNRPLDGRADLYSLGVVLYQLLTGELPYQGTDGWAIGMQHLSAPLPKLPATLARYQTLLDALMAKSPAQRPQSGAEVARRVEALQAGLTPIPTQPIPVDTLPRSRALLLAGVAALLLVAWYFAPRTGWQAVAPPPRAVMAERSIAVLPLVNMSGDPSNEYFSDGLAETTLDMLARLPDLRVIARTSSFAFKGQNTDVREIGKQLNVAHLLEGSVQRDGNRVRITAQLVRAADGAHLWSQRYDREVTDVFAIQDEIAASVVDAIQGVLPADQARPQETGGTHRLDAYEAYLKGNALLSQRRAGDLEQALAHFERAIELDADYARAHIGAAIALSLLNSASIIDSQQRAQRKHFVERALALAPYLGEAHVAAGAQLRDDGDLGGAENAFRRGIELAPGFALGFQWYGELLLEHGQPERGLALLERARALNPLAPTDQAVAVYRSLGENAPQDTSGRKSLRAAEDPVAVGLALRNAGKPDQAKALWRYALTASNARKHELGAFGLGWSEVYLYSLLGEQAASCGAMRAAAEAGYFIDAWRLEADPELAALRAHSCFAPRIAEIKQLAGAEVQLAREAVRHTD